MSSSNWHKSEFTFQREALLDKIGHNSNPISDNISQNGFEAKKLECLIVRTKEIEQQIEKLKFDLEADTAYIATRFQNNLNYPRFNGYREFIRGNYFPGTDSKTRVLDLNFGQLVYAYLTGDLESEEDVRLAKSKLGDFIWLFFEGCGEFKREYGIELVKYENCQGDTLYPSYYDYAFNVLLPDSGKSYQVTIRFFDIENAMNYASYSQHDYGRDGKNFGEYYAIRACDFGKTEAIVRKKLFGLDDHPIGETKHERDWQYKDYYFSKNRLTHKTFDPIEIAAWFDSLFSENGSCRRELEILEEEKEEKEERKLVQQWQAKVL